MWTLQMRVTSEDVINDFISLVFVYVTSIHEWRLLFTLRFSFDCWSQAFSFCCTLLRYRFFCFRSMNPKHNLLWHFWSWCLMKAFLLIVTLKSLCVVSHVFSLNKWLFNDLLLSVSQFHTLITLSWCSSWLNQGFSCLKIEQVRVLMLSGDAVISAWMYDHCMLFNLRSLLVDTGAPVSYWFFLNLIGSCLNLMNIISDER